MSNQRRRGAKREKGRWVGSAGGGNADLFPRLNRVLVNTGMTKLAVGRAGTSLVTFNEHAHIDAAGAEPLSYR